MNKSNIDFISIGCFYIVPIAGLGLQKAWFYIFMNKLRLQYF